MSEITNPDEVNLTTRAFTLLRRLSEDGKLTPEEIHELLQTQKKMASSELIPQLQNSLESLGNRIDSVSEKLGNRIDSVSEKLDSYKEATNSKLDAQNSKFDAQNSKYHVLIVIISIIGAALTIALAVN